MAGHHCHGGKSVRHAWRELVYAVTARRVAHEVNAVWIHIMQRHKVFNQPVEESINVALVP